MRKIEPELRKIHLLLRKVSLFLRKSSVFLRKEGSLLRKNSLILRKIGFVLRRINFFLRKISFFLRIDGFFLRKDLTVTGKRQFHLHLDIIKPLAPNCLELLQLLYRDRGHFYSSPGKALAAEPDRLGDDRRLAGARCAPSRGYPGD